MDESQNVWAGTEKGVFFAKPGEDSRSTNSGAALLRAAGDARRRYLGGHGGRVVADSGGKWRQFTTADGLRSKSVVSLAADQSGALWIGYRLTGTVTRLSLDNGKVTDGLRSGARDQHHLLSGFRREGNSVGRHQPGDSVARGRWQTLEPYDHRDGLDSGTIAICTGSRPRRTAISGSEPARACRDFYRAPRPSSPSRRARCSPAW